jgi:CHAT domain-containing protein
MTTTGLRRAGLFAGLIAAAAMVLVLARGYGVFQPSGERPELQALFAALAEQPERPIRARLAGVLVYAPPPMERRGSGAPGVSPDVTIAAARIDKRTDASGSARHYAALGVAYLAVGDWDKGIDVLEDAVQREPANALFQNDLAAAYLARAAEGATPEDWARALAAANRAVARDPKRPEPHFNRALAFEGLHLAVEEADAWKAYQAIDAAGPWRAEAGKRLESVERRYQEQIARAVGEPDNQTLRERIEGDLLPRWGAAVERGDAVESERMLAEAGRLADQVAAAGGDVMARDEVALIRRHQAAGREDLVGHLAVGHRIFGEAATLFGAARRLEASQSMAQASRRFSRAGSAYWQWAPVYRAVFLWSAGDSPAGLEALKAVPLGRLPAEYRALRGRLAWVDALARQASGRFDEGRLRLAEAVELFRRAGEHDNLVAVQTNLAESDWFLGDRQSAWSNLAHALSAIERRGQTRRVGHLDLAATMSLGSGLFEAALEFQHALVRKATNPPSARDARIRRARTWLRLGNRTAAAEDLAVAASSLNGIADASARARLEAEIEIVRAELFSGVDCGRSMQHAAAALAYLDQVTGSIRRASLLRVRARCRATAGDIAGARADLLSSVKLFEDRQATLARPADRAQAFELERAAFRDLLMLEAVTLDDEAEGFRVAERARSGALAEAWDRGVEAPDHRDLPPDVAVIYYESLADRVLVWVLTREGRTAFQRPIGEAELVVAVGRVRRAIQRGVDLEALRPYTAGLFDSLIAPALALADRRDGVAEPSPKTRLVFIPDGPLFGLPFNAIPDERGQPLLQTRTVGIAPSFKTFIAASSRLATFMPSDVLAVGDGHDPVSTGLPMLPRADAEAAAVGRAYSTSVVLAGPQATRRRFLGASAPVIHFAGHAVLNEGYPMLSRLLLAPEPAVDAAGSLLATEITPARFDQTGVVMLATCEGAAGRPVEGEGAISLARSFFAAGVPGVVASLWPVDDDLQTLVLTFHRSLREERDAATALRAAQRAILEERGPRTPVRVWGGFVMLGGITPAH